ncbi:tyrosine-protein phosphatase [Fundidesulfovibrio soli]|uniref:tyrosine-protein phosphatase n=1 Tax=Fundidesulfovibrio soli TaxID=2922716 RepID=UPI001FAF3356|nr:tyrosine-protein phosphatase [Fundidesulfovibrio soli]
MPAFAAHRAKSILYVTITLILCLSCAPARAQQPITTPILASAPNFRDIAGISASNGGTGFVNATSNFGVMRTGAFYRSSALTLSNTDLATVSRLGIVRDIDLRTPTEIGQTPDVLPAGAQYTNVNVFGTSGLPIDTSQINSQAALLRTAQEGYRTFVTNPASRAGFGAVLLTMAHDPGPDLFHCSDGKDRTGWTAALLETIAGVSPATRMQDYLASNSYLAGPINAQAAAVLAVAPELRGMNFNLLFGVDSSWLQAALDQVTASYGSMYGYLTQGLGLSQADIYVLRAKMVYYPVVAGQAGLAGNAASGAALLNQLQNSPLSGRYTSYNYYFQSAVDEGSLGGVQTQVGGQVHADAAAYLMRQSQRIDEAIRPFTESRDLPEGQTRYWLAGFGGGFRTNGYNGAAESTEYNAGSMIGATRRFNGQASASLGIGYNWGSVGSSDATADINAVLATLGGRYGFSSLESGPFVEGRADAGWIGCQSRRGLGGGLGTATGNGNGAVYGGRAGLGHVLRLAPLTVTPQAGVRVAGVSLGSLSEGGSDLALNVHGINKTTASLLADLDIALDARQLGAWTITPALTLGYERMLANPQVESVGTLYGYSVSQASAFESWNLFKAGLGVTAQRDALTLKARCNGVLGDGARSAGLSGQLSLAYSF